MGFFIIVTCAHEDQKTCEPNILPRGEPGILIFIKKKSHEGKRQLWNAP